eukprot:3342057-Heterocapsa_arctica.AAC.1
MGTHSAPPTQKCRGGLHHRKPVGKGSLRILGRTEEGREEGGEERKKGDEKRRERRRARKRERRRRRASTHETLAAASHRTAGEADEGQREDARKERGDPGPRATRERAGGQ